MDAHQILAPAVTQIQAELDQLTALTRVQAGAIEQLNLDLADTKAATEETLFEVDPDTATTLGPVKAATGKTLFGPTYGTDAAYKPLTLVGHPNRGKVLDVTLQPNMVGAKSGINLFLPLRRRARQATLSMDLHFPLGFDWSGGGKAVGLIATQPGGDPADPTGGNGDPGTSASCRCMWNGPKGGWTRVIGTRPNLANAYCYHPGQASQYGEDNFPLPRRQFIDGEWHHLVIDVEMNTPGRLDGGLQMVFDGETVLNLDDYRWRDDETVEWSHLCLAIFRGGATVARFGSATVGHIQVDNVAVTTRR